MGFKDKVLNDWNCLYAVVAVFSIALIVAGAIYFSVAEKHEQNFRTGLWVQTVDYNGSYTIVKVNSSSLVIYMYTPETNDFRFVDFGEYQIIDDRVVCNDKVLTFDKENDQMTYDGGVFRKDGTNG